ncbi:MAG: flagellar biosynthetic protein FliO [Chromatiaceae bacterium]|nr:flagellar biosynthetic protein FliO [Chromatiaceae bacterium]
MNRRLVAAALLMPWCAFGATDTGATLDGATYLTQLASGLLAVIAVILALAWVLRRLPTATGARPDAIEILAVRAVGTRDRLLLVRVGDEQLLIASGPAGLRTLHRLRHPIVIEETTPGEDLSFARLLRRARKGAAQSEIHP